MQSSKSSPSTSAAITTSSEDPDWWRRYDPLNLPQPKAAALEEFVRLGYHGTSIRRIATTAGMTIQGLYYHFRSKEEMLATLLLDAQKDIVRRRDAALRSAGDDPRSRFMVQVENSALHTMYRQAEASLAREIRVLTEPTQSEVLALRHDLEATFYSEIERGRDEGIFTTSDPHSVGRAILALCRSIAGWYDPAGPRSAEEIAQQYVEFALLLVGDRGRDEAPRQHDPQPASRHR